MLNIGCHMTINGGLANAVRESLQIGANTFQFFSGNPRGGKSVEFDREDVEEFLKIANLNNFSKIIAHAPYTMNLCSINPGVRKFSLNFFKEDIKKMESIPGNFYNFHPGCHSGQGVKTGSEFISRALVETISEKTQTTVLLETMSGKGSEIGFCFDEISDVIKKSGIKNLGVCFDTCHVHDSGYNISDNLDRILYEFDKKVGIKKLKAVHLNDSKNPFGSRKDRHEKIGKGYIGEKTFERIVNHPDLKNLLFILETPNDMKGYAEEIALLKKLASTS